MYTTSHSRSRSTSPSAADNNAGGGGENDQITAGLVKTGNAADNAANSIKRKGKSKSKIFRLL
jgi:hypothetical protein